MSAALPVDGARRRGLRRPSGPGAGGGGRHGLARWLAPLWLVALAFGLVSLHVVEYTELSPVDELQHIDYLYKSPGIVAPGDRVDDEAMREEACRGIDAPGFVTPPCSDTYDYQPEQFQELGFNTASINTPVYYTATWLVAAPLDALAGLDSLVTAGRLVGGAWLALGLVLTYAAGRRLAVPRVPLVAVLTTYAATHAVLYPASTITPDAANLAAGAGSLLALLYWEEAPRRRWPVLVVVPALVLLLKMTNVMGLLAVGLYMVIRFVRAVAGRDPAADAAGAAARARVAGAAHWLLGGAVLALTTVTVLGATLALQSALTHVDPTEIPMTQRFLVDALPVDGLVESIGVFINPLGTLGVTVGDPELLEVSERAIGAVFVAGVIAAAVLGDGTNRARRYAQAALLTLVVGAPIFVVVSYLGQSVFVSPPGRYAMTLVPIVVVATAELVRTRGARWLAVGFAVVMLAGTVIRILLEP